MVTLRINTLGPFQIALGDDPVEGITSERVQALLAYLALEARQPLSRETAAELLWPARPPGVARRNLRQALKRLQDALPDPVRTPSFLLVDRETLRLNPDAPIRIDVTAFNDALAFTRGHTHRRLHRCRRCAAKLATAAALYRGDFLEGIIADSPPLDEWILLQREWLRREALGALHSLGAFHLWQGDFERAYESARQQVTLDPLREAGHRQVIQALARAGRRREALDQYRSLEHLLAEELDVRPSARSRQLYEEIRSGETATRPEYGAAPPFDRPVTGTPFVGREEELASISERLDHPDCRLLTLVGPGGAGKTRLAVQIGLEKADEFQDGIAYVSLVAIESHTALLTAVASGLGVEFSGRARDDAARQTQLLNYLAGREMLLVLDNYEQLLPETDLLIALLAETTRVKVLVTSREPLHLQAEWLLDVPGMTFPMSRDLDSGDPVQFEAAEILSFEAVRLFDEAAQRVQAGFSLTPENLPPVVRVCQLVEGLPLALELAAAWLRSHTPQEIARAIEASLDFLTSAMRDVPERHRSLRAVFGHSWDSLKPPERTALAGLSVFRGPFTPAAAEAVAGVSRNLLADLAAKSLLQPVEERGYGLHELIRQYAAEKLSADPAEETSTRDRHSDYYARWLEGWTDDLYGPRVIAAAAEVGAALSNLRAAWRWAAERSRLKTLRRAVLPLARFYTVTSALREGADALALAGEALERAGGAADAAVRERLSATLWAERAGFLNLLGDYVRAVAMVQKAVGAARAVGDVDAEAAACLQWGIALWRQGAYGQAVDRLRRAYDLARPAESGPPDRVRHSIAGESQRILAYVYLHQGLYPRARRYLEAALQVHRRAGNRWAEAYVLGGIGNILLVQDLVEAAKPYYEQALELLQELGDAAGETIYLDNLGTIHLAQGEFDRAYASYGRALRLRRRVGDRRGEGASLGKLGLLADALGDYATAASHYRQALAIYSEIGYQLGIATILARQSLLRHHQGDHPGSLASGREALAIATATGDRSYQAYARMAMGHALTALDRLPEAADCYREALALRREMGERNRAMEALSGLAEVALAQGELARALEYVDTILGHLETAGLGPSDEPLRVYLTCYRVLEAAGDPRAGPLLRTADRELRRRAAGIADEALRRSFLEDVAANRAIVAARGER